QFKRANRLSQGRRREQNMAGCSGGEGLVPSADCYTIPGTGSQFSGSGPAPRPARDAKKSCLPTTAREVERPEGCRCPPWETTTAWGFPLARRERRLRRDAVEGSVGQTHSWISGAGEPIQSFQRVTCNSQTPATLLPLGWSICSASATPTTTSAPSSPCSVLPA